MHRAYGKLLFRQLNKSVKYNGIHNTGTIRYRVPYDQFCRTRTSTEVETEKFHFVKVTNDCSVVVIQWEGGGKVWLAFLGFHLGVKKL